MRPPPVTRLAPSPTGALHLGNARTFLVNWVVARQRGWRVVLRIDDLEGPRVKRGADVMAIEDLAWLGLDWEGEIVRQSQRGDAYAAALRQLTELGRVYRCTCTRSEIEAAGAVGAVGAVEAVGAGGVGADAARIYPGTCRAAPPPEDEPRPACRRFAVDLAPVAFQDEVYGPQRFDPPRELGDFVIRKSDGEFGYQLATVVDDAAAGVTHVIRGHDLLASTPRQLMLYKALGLGEKVPQYAHLPLVVGPDGRKLAKRHGDTRLRQLRGEGVSAGQVRALLARWSGFDPHGPEAGTAEWIDRFDLARLPRPPVPYDDTRDRPATTGPR